LVYPGDKANSPGEEETLRQRFHCYFQRIISVKGRALDASLLTPPIDGLRLFESGLRGWPHGKESQYLV
jgi:hypothetical protein